MKSAVQLVFSVAKRMYSSAPPAALRSKKHKSKQKAKELLDVRIVSAVGGRGGDGCVSFLQLFKNEYAGPDGGDGGNGGHVILEATTNVNGLAHVDTSLRGDAGEKGYNKDCNGRNADHTVVKVPIGTIVKNVSGRVVADLKEEKMMFIAARGGAGGRGNHFFASPTETTPQVAEYGAEGEMIRYKLELSCIAHFGLLGFPNAGKSTLLQAVTRANPKVAPYPFTTLKPHLGIIQYTDMEQVTLADLPGLIEGSHKNKGLGISFLRHAERCMGLLILLDMSLPDPWTQLEILRNEVLCFSRTLSTRPQIIVANKMDMPASKENLESLKQFSSKDKIVPVSAKIGHNLSSLLKELRIVYDEQMARREQQANKDTETLKSIV